MLKRDEAYRSMVEKVLLMLVKFITVWEKNKLMEGAVTIIRAKLEDLNKFWKIQLNVAKGLGAIKKKKRTKLNNSTFIMFGIIRTYALSINNEKLYADYKASISTIRDVKDTEMEAYAATTQKTIEKYKDELMQHGLTQKMIETYGKEADGFITALAAPAEAKAEQQVATEGIARTIKEIRAILDNKMDTYIIQYMSKNSEFYDTYQFARIIYDNPTQNYSLIGMVRDKKTKLIISGVKVEVKFKAGAELQTKVKKTGKHGNYIFKTLPAGVWEITFKYAGYHDYATKVVIHDNKTTRLDVQMQEIKETE
jgi:hypothetical protein